MSTETHSTDHTHDDHLVEHPTDTKYIQIALVLGAITAVEVAASYIDIGKLFVPLLVVAMITKFGIVAGFFMHLRFDNRLFTRVFVAGILLAIGVYLVFLTTLEVFAA